MGLTLSTPGLVTSVKAADKLINVYLLFDLCQFTHTLNLTDYISDRFKYKDIEISIQTVLLLSALLLLISGQYQGEEGV